MEIEVVVPEPVEATVNLSLTWSEFKVLAAGTAVSIPNDAAHWLNERSKDEAMTGTLIIQIMDDLYNQFEPIIKRGAK